MKRILPVALGIIVLLFAGLLIGPSFMDWNKYKPQIVEQVKSAAGYDVKIDGDLSLSLLPSPQLKIEGLSVAAPRGKEPVLLSMKQANVSVKLFPLISGDIEIDTVRLVNPDIRIEILPDGTNSWLSDKLQSEEAALSSDGTISSQKETSNERNVSLNKLVIDGGRVAYLDRRTGQSQTAENINLSVSADSLSGPFDVGGAVTYNGKIIEIDAQTEGPLQGKKEIPASIELSLPESKSTASFKGIIAVEPMEIQGKINIDAPNLAQALAFGGDSTNSPLAQKLAFSGLVTANDDRIASDDVDITFGDTKGKGSLTLSNMKARDPAKLEADMAFEGILDFDRLVPAKDKSKESSVEEKVAKGKKLSPSGDGFLPETLSLPFPLDAQVRIAAEGIKKGGQVYKGVTSTIAKTGPTLTADIKALDMPGKTNAQLNTTIAYQSSSKNGDTGIVYADPKASFKATGGSSQLPTLLRSFSQGQDSNTAFEIYKTAQFDLSGTITQSAIQVVNSTVKLDETTVALNAAYKPMGEAGRPDIALDVATDKVDIDYIQSRLNGQKQQAVQKDAAAKPDVKTVLEPVRSFEVPVNLSFDFSAQNAIYNKQQVQGIRIKGRAAGQSLQLDAASVQDYMGAAANLKGTVSNLKDLTGINLSFYGKTQNLKNLLQSFSVDTSKLPQNISAAEALISAKGVADELNFDAKISALNGELNAAGVLNGLLTTPSFNNLLIGASHPNLVQAVQLVNPAFTGGPGLEKPFDFEAKAVKSGNVYELSGMQASLGQAAFNGNLTVDTGGAKPSVKGDIKAGDIALDSLLGAKSGGQSSGTSAGANLSSAADPKGKWSRATLETGWMHSVNLDLGLSANSITYGGWNFTKPTTKINLKDGNLLVDNLQSGLFGGTASLTAKVNDPADPKQPLSMGVQSRMENVELEPLATALSGTRKIRSSGDVSLDFSVQTTGLSPHALVSGLQGKANLGGENVVFKGFDLAQIGLAFVDTGKPLDRLGGIVGGATQNGETRFDTVKGVYDIMQGIVTISSMAMDGPAANIVSKGNVNLPLWTIDTIHTITFKQAKEAGAFDVAIKGSLSSPANTFGKGLFNDVLTRRLQQKAVEKLPDVLGKDLGGKLQDLGILPQKQQPAPVPVPAPETTAPADPAVQPAPAPEPAAPQTPEDQLKEEGAKAIQGVLDGLLR